MVRVITVANQKGGVAKTTTVLNVAAALAEGGARVLMVDLDPQGSLTLASGFAPDALEVSLYDGLLKEVPAEAFLLPTAFGPDLLPSNVDLSRESTSRRRRGPPTWSFRRIRTREW